MLSILLAVLLAQATTGQPASVTDVRSLKPSQPAILAELDAATISGDPVGLACRADGMLYLRVGAGKAPAHHYLIATRPRLSIGQADGLPAWAADYWTWKSGIVAPKDPALKIDVEQRAERSRSVNTPSGGDLAGMASPVMAGGGGEGVSLGLAMAAANSSILSGIVTLRFKGHVVSEWTNEVPLLGVRFGWAPAPMGMLAYADEEGRLFIVDREGRTVRVPGATHALLPAWSPDGRRLLWLQKKSRNVYLLAEASLQ